MIVQKKAFFLFMAFVAFLFCFEITYIMQKQRDMTNAKKLVNLVGLYDLPIWVNDLHVRHRTLKNSEGAFDYHPGFPTRSRASFIVSPQKQKSKNEKHF